MREEPENRAGGVLAGGPGADAARVARAATATTSTTTTAAATTAATAARHSLRARSRSCAGTQGQRRERKRTQPGSVQGQSGAAELLGHVVRAVSRRNPQPDPNSGGV